MEQFDMTVPGPLLDDATPTSLQQCMRQACSKFAPTWPLDRSIAVNPWWEMRAEPFSKVAARLATLGKINCLMPGAYYKRQWGRAISPSHLQMAKNELKTVATQEQLLAALETSAVPKPWHNFVDFLDDTVEQRNKMAWRAEVEQQISQFCGAFFQYPERMLSGVSAGHAFFQSWREVVGLDKGIGILMGAREINQQIHSLPESISGVYEAFHKEVFAGQFSEAACVDYATSLLLDVNGWTSWLAYQAWQDRLVGNDNDLIEQLLAIRLCWELLLWRHLQVKTAASYELIKRQFLAQFQRSAARFDEILQNQQLLWVWQRALEYAYQEPLQQQLLKVQPSPAATPKVLAIFCIDVRSEPMRRALEAQDPAIQTAGFAGFFGLPIEYRNSFTSEARPQLPGLLSPVLSVSKVAVSALERKQNASIQRKVGNQDASNIAPASFGLVEAGGVFKAFDLLRYSFSKLRTRESISPIEKNSIWELRSNGVAISKEDQAQLLLSILQALGLKKDFPEHVLLVGHASHSANNPHAASLDCGACGGQSGEVNVRVLAQLLNDASLREILASHQVMIPNTTRFVPALHNTSLDEIVCFDSPDEAPYSQWLRGAESVAQHARAPSLGIEAKKTNRIASAMQERSNDWAQLRPEWGLANNASFIVAPRAFTRQINLEGRSFLHDYTWQSDAGFKVLELIITAPMIVTNWINLQYYASVVDPDKYGSGNKLLHNVVGEHIGVFEGNGGDLRIGLPIQSVHDGSDWRHQPLRLSVYIAAPIQAIADIINAQPAVRELLDNDWLFLFAWDLEARSMARYHAGQWTPVTEEDAHV